MKNFKKAMLIMIAALVATSGTDANASARATKKVGLAIGFITEPIPSLIGYSLSYNFNNRMRATVGYGAVSATGGTLNVDVTTLGFDLKYSLLDWNFAPFLSGGFTNVSGTVSGTGSTSGLSISSTGFAGTFGAGLDWQTYFGFNLGLAYKYVMASGNAYGAPGLYIGWYF